MASQGIIEEYLHYGNWVATFGWFLIFLIFIVFLPYHKKTSKKPSNIYIAFIVASAFEMFGIPLSMYFLAWTFGVTIPRGIFWGHTLEGVIGYWGMYIGFLLNIIGGILIYRGWKAVYRQYWSKEESDGKLVTTGVYQYSRHPQYTGFIIMTLGLLIHWATLPLLLMWPLLVVQYYRLAKSEESTMEEKFGEEYIDYKQRVPMFIGLPKNRS
jgi:protein-S-isoprenylcysteine O-methyltransferase Ste14